MIITAYTFPNVINELETFFNNYTIEEFVVCPIEEVKNLKPKEERVCRFCRLDASQTTFKKRPHIISELLGNKYLISDFECDNCNKYFGKNYENDLVHFLGMSRTFSGVKNKNNKIPDFNSSGYKLMASRKEFNGIKDGLKISIHKSAKGIFNLDDKAGKAEIKYPKPSFIPIKVYKALLKIALSIVPEKYVKDYKYAFHYLFNDDDEFSNVAKISIYELPYNHRASNPVCFLFKKSEATNRITSHVFALYFQNHIFQFPIPFFGADIDNNLYNGESYSIPICPPILFSKPQSEAHYFHTIKDLSSKDKSNEEEAITFSFDPNLMSNLKAYNPATGEVTDTTLNADDIIEIYITSSNSKISFPKNQ